MHSYAAQLGNNPSLSIAELAAVLSDLGNYPAAAAVQAEAIKRVKDSRGGSRSMDMADFLG